MHEHFMQIIVSLMFRYDVKHKHAMVKTNALKAIHIAAHHQYNDVQFALFEVEIIYTLYSILYYNLLLFLRMK